MVGRACDGTGWARRVWGHPDHRGLYRTLGPGYRRIGSRPGHHKGDLLAEFRRDAARAITDHRRPPQSTVGRQRHVKGPDKPVLIRRVPVRSADRTVAHIAPIDA